MAEEKQLLGNSEAVRELIVPDFQQRESPTKTERDISNEPRKGGESSNSDQTCIDTDTVRKLVIPTSDEGSKSSDDDRSPGRTERSLGRPER